MLDKNHCDAASALLHRSRIRSLLIALTLLVLGIVAICDIGDLSRAKGAFRSPFDAKKDLWPGLLPAVSAVRAWGGHMLEQSSRRLDEHHHQNQDPHRQKHVHPVRRLPKCKLYADTYGKWVPSSSILLTPQSRLNLEASFFGGGPGYALSYDNVWVPHHCAHHRFTRDTIEKCVDWSIAHRPRPAQGRTEKPEREHFFEISLMGDSALRGITCGIARILQGNEYDGPCDNFVCGGKDMHVIASGNGLGHPFTIELSKRLKITFTFVTTFFSHHFDWMLEWEVGSNCPNVNVVNTGAWDFSDIAREMNHRGVRQSGTQCMWPNQTDVSKRRTQPWVNSTIIHEYGRLARQKGVRMIYRGSHHNARFGVDCADKELTEMMTESGLWEVFDNSRMSEEVWRNQTWDGFHFDRDGAHSVLEHHERVHKARSKGGETPGQLEMQLSQSLLQSIFHDCLQNHPDFEYDSESDIDNVIETVPRLPPPDALMSQEV